MNKLPASNAFTSQWPGLHRAASALGLLGALLFMGQALAQGAETASVTGRGPIVLRDTPAVVAGGNASKPDLGNRDDTNSKGNPAAVAVYKPSEFERYVQRQPGANEIRRLGHDLADATADTAAGTPLVPADYLLQSGDEIALTLWGSVEADLRLTVDRVGRVTIPRVGTVMVAGVRHADLAEVIRRRVDQVFKNYQLSVALGQLRGMRVFVTGFVNKPGAIAVSSLSTLSHALLRAGGPAAAGSFRNIQLRRGKETIAQFDFYDLLLKGDRGGDRVLQPDDVIHVGPLGPLVAVVGSVNRSAIFELRPNETASDVLRMAGGFSAVADTSRLTLERVSERNNARITLVESPEKGSFALVNGDVLRAYSAVELLPSIVTQNKRIRVEGEVLRPGEYVLPNNSTLSDALVAAGGLSSKAFLFGVEFNRESVRQTQAVNYERALRDFETEMIRAPVTLHVNNKDEADSRTASTDAGMRLLERLRAVRPTGRIVLQLEPNAQSLPDMVLEDGDRLYVPPRPNTVGVFGSVFSAGSYLHVAGRPVGDYLRLAGGPTRRADEGSVFVVRANGTVRSSLPDTGFFNRGNQLVALPTEPGDTIFVPDEFDRTTWIQSAKDWTQIFYQFGLGLAGFRTAFR